MALSVITGVTRVQDVADAMKVIDIDKRIWDPELGLKSGENANAAFFMALGNFKEAGTVHNPQFKVIDTALPRRSIAIATLPGGATGTTFTVAAGLAKYFRPYDFWYNPVTNETYQVVSVNTATNTITVIRDYGAVLGSPSGSTSTNTLHYAGHALEDGGIYSDIIAMTEDVSYNYISLVDSTYGMTLLQKNTDVYGEDYWTKEKRLAAFEFRLKCDRQIALGIRNYAASPINPGKMIYSTGGIRQHMKGQVFDCSTAAGAGTISERVMDLIVEQFFQNGSETKMLFCGTHFGSAMTSFAKNRLQLDDQKTKTYGMQVRSYFHNGYTLDIIVHNKFFEGFGATGGTGLASEAWVIDPNLVELVTMQGIKTKVNTNVQQSGTSQQIDQYYGSIGLRMRPGLDFTYNAASGVPTQYLSPHGRVINFNTYV